MLKSVPVLLFLLLPLLIMGEAVAKPIKRGERPVPPSKVRSTPTLTSAQVLHISFVVSHKKNADGRVTKKLITGSGFVTTHHNKLGIMTAWHVVADSPTRYATVRGNGYSKRFGPFIRFKLAGPTDIGWCAIKKVPRKWKALERAPSIHGRNCSAWGYAKGALFRGYDGINYGIKKKVAGDFAKKSSGSIFLDISGIAIGGMSGGPVIDSKGRVFALVSLTAWYGGTNQHWPTAIPGFK